MANKTFWRDAKGNVRWTPFLAWFGLLTIVGFIFLGPEFAYGFTHRFWRAGIWNILGPAVAIFLFIKLNSHYDREQDAKGLSWWMFAIAAIFWAGLFGPAIGQKEDRKGGIPDVRVYWGNGKVMNATDGSKENYYFNVFDVHGADSAYIVQYGEEPGYNIIWQSIIPPEPKSNNPRANENWIRPAPKTTIDIKSWRR